MTADRIIMIILAIFFVISALDRCFGNHLGLGPAFERGVSLMGKVALSIMGLICLTPVLANLLTPVVVPLFDSIGIDPGMFPSLFLSPDSGGWNMARELGHSTDIADFGGLVVSAVMGGVVSFSIPAAVGIIPKSDTKYLAVGVMASFIVDPIGCFVGGLVQGLPAALVFRCLIPVTALGLLLALGLALIPNIMIRGFQLLSKFLLLLLTIGVVLGAVEKMTGFVILPGMRPIDEAFKTVGTVVLMLAGTLPLVSILDRIAKKPLKQLAARSGISENSFTYGLSSLASILPACSAFSEMNIKGKVFISACIGSCSNMLGPHIGFAASANQAMIVPMLAAKIVAGILAIPLALWFGNRLFRDEFQKEHS